MRIDTVGFEFFDAHIPHSEFFSYLAFVAQLLVCHRANVLVIGIISKYANGSVLSVFHLHYPFIAASVALSSSSGRDNPS